VAQDKGHAKPHHYIFAGKRLVMPFEAVLILGRLKGRLRIYQSFFLLHLASERRKKDLVFF
jgi:hypothetical protein